jgi:hypothetical protein
MPRVEHIAGQLDFRGFSTSDGKNQLRKRKFHFL